eukprot:518931-Amphidinium_carterae.1
MISYPAALHPTLQNRTIFFTGDNLTRQIACYSELQRKVHNTCRDVALQKKTKVNQSEHLPSSSGPCEVLLAPSNCIKCMFTLVLSMSLCREPVAVAPLSSVQAWVFTCVALLVLAQDGP